MASTVPAVSFVRCPKCLRVLAELPEIPLFKCCGCDAILSAEVHSDNCSSDNGLAIYVKEISTGSVKPETLEQAAMMNLAVSDSNGESSEENMRSDVYEDNNIKNRSLEQDKGKPSDQSGYSAHSLNQVMWKSTDQIVPESLADNLAISMKKSGEDIVMNNSFKAEEQPAPQTNYRKFYVQAKVQNTLCVLEKEEPSLMSQSNDSEHFVKFRCSEKDDPVKILEKVDQLKIKLHRMFSKRSDGKESSSFSIKVTHFEGKASSKENQLSLIPSSRQQKNSSSLLCHPAGICCQNGKCRRCQEIQIRHCRPVSGGAPFVICYRCYKLLQLPADFLVSTKRVHKLRCGSCSEVLVFSYKPRIRAAPNQ